MKEGIFLSNFKLIQYTPKQLKAFADRNAKIKAMQDARSATNMSLVHAMATATLPTSTSNYKYLSPVRDQGQEGSCASFSICAIREWWENQQGQSPFVTLSPQIIYNQYLQEAQSTNPPLYDDGATVAAIAQSVFYRGLAPEVDEPYIASLSKSTKQPDGSYRNLFNTPDLGNAQVDANTLLQGQQAIGDGYAYAFTGASDCFEEVLSGTYPDIITDICSRISSGLPVHIGIAVCDDWNTINGIPASYNGIIDYKPTANIQGFHALPCIDYKLDANGKHLFLVKNSWGLCLGEVLPPVGTPAPANTAGYLWITEAYLLASGMFDGSMTAYFSEAMVYDCMNPLVYSFNVGPYANLANAIAAKTAIYALGKPVQNWINEVDSTHHYVVVGQYPTSALATTAKGQLTGYTCSAVYSTPPTIASNYLPKPILIESLFVYDGLCQFVCCGLVDASVNSLNIYTGFATSGTPLTTISGLACILNRVKSPQVNVTLGGYYTFVPVTSAGPQPAMAVTIRLYTDDLLDYMYA